VNMTENQTSEWQSFEIVDVLLLRYDFGSQNRTKFWLGWCMRLLAMK
jgi:hypothetical protein